MTLRYFFIIICLLVFLGSATGTLVEYNAGSLATISGTNLSTVLSDSNALGGNSLRFNQAYNRPVNGTLVWQNTTNNSLWYSLRDNWSSWNTLNGKTSQGSHGAIEWAVEKSTPLGQTILVTKDAQNDVLFQVRNQTGWVAQVNLTLTASPSSMKNIDVAVDNTTGKVMVVYINQTNGTINYLIWNGTAISTNSSFAIGNTTIVWSWIRLESHPSKNEMILAAQTQTIGNSGSLPDLYVAHWNGPANVWDNVTNLENNTEVGTSQPFDIAYEQLSGDAIVVWGNATNTSMQSRQFTTSWTTTNLPVPFVQTAAFNWVKLADFPSNSTNLGTNEVMACYGEDTGNATSYDIGCILWSGTAWQTGVELDTDAEGGARATARPFDVVADPTTGGFIVGEIPNAKAVPTFKRCMNSSACSSGTINRWESYAAIFSLVALDDAWLTLRGNPYTAGQFIVLQKVQITPINYRGNFTCTSAVGSCSGSGGNLVSLGTSSNAARESYDFTFDAYSVSNIGAWFNSTDTTSIGSGTTNYLNVTMRVNSTFQGNYSMLLYNWSSANWNYCSSAIIPANTFINLTCTVCTGSGCNLTNDPADYRANNGNPGRNITVALNKTSDWGSGLSLNGTVEVDYIKYFVDYTVDSTSLSFTMFILGASNTTSTLVESKSTPMTPNINFTCTTSGCTQSNVNACNTAGSPTCQDKSNSIFTFYNTGNVALNWNVALNASTPVGTSMFCDTDSDPNGALTLSTRYQALSTFISAGSAKNGWCWTNFTDVQGGIYAPRLFQHNSTRS